MACGVSCDIRISQGGWHAQRVLWRERKVSWALEVEDRVRIETAGSHAPLTTWMRIAWEAAPKRRGRRRRVVALPEALVTANRRLRLLTWIVSDLRVERVTRATLDGLGKAISWGLVQGVQPDWRWQLGENHAMATRQPW